MTTSKIITAKSVTAKTVTSRLEQWARRVLAAYVGHHEAHLRTMNSATTRS